ncbi:hypothetical protein C6499_09545 [Candidatus Poribacteria bacterium]|nr:MAG: hypothetical protein C6499_09545 [Candidatus Poribacteria bacterium]
MSSNTKGKFPITDIEAFWIVILTTIQTAFYIAWRLANGIELNVVFLNSGAVVPLWTLVSTFIVQMREVAMFLRDKITRNREKLKAEGRAERDAEWIEWAKNGKNPDEMPSKVNPVQTAEPKNREK